MPRRRSACAIHRQTVPDGSSAARTVGRRPAGIIALSLFFVFGAVMSGTTAGMLATPGGPLDPVWRLRPLAREQLAPLGIWGVLLMATVSLACIGAAVGLWTGRRAGYRLAAALLLTNLLGDLANAVVRRDPRTLIGIPIVAVLLWYLRLRQPIQPRGVT
jgi:hypothetical protein